MPMPPEAERMLAIARCDLETLRWLLPAPVALDAQAGFHAQQAAEKALKAWLVVLGQRYPFTHDLGDLLDRLINAGVEVAEFEALDPWLTPFAVLGRYDPYPLPALTIDRAAAAIAIAVAALIDHVAAQGSRPDVI